MKVDDRLFGFLFFTTIMLFSGCLGIALFVSAPWYFKPLGAPLVLSCCWWMVKACPRLSGRDRQ